MDRAEARLLSLWIDQQRAQWVSSNFITDDTELIAASADQAVKAATADLAQQARRFAGLTLPPDLARKFLLLKLSVSVPAPRDRAGAGGTGAHCGFAGRRLRQGDVVSGRH